MACGSEGQRTRRLTGAGAKEARLGELWDAPAPVGG